MKKLKIGVLVSGGGSNLQAIIDACESGKIDGEVVFVGSDRPDVFGLKRAEKHGIPSFVVDYDKRLEEMKGQNDPSLLADFSPDDFDLEEAEEASGKYDIAPPNVYEIAGLMKRAIIEDELFRTMSQYQFDLLALAGFMKLLSPCIIRKINTNQYQLKIMNIHPALLPSFPGTDGYGDTLSYGCKVGGCTVHFVDYGEDTGPIIGQRSLNIIPGEDLESFKKRGLRVEHELFPECIQLFAEGRLRVIDQELRDGTKRKNVEILPANSGIEVLDEGAEFKFMGIEDCPQARCGI